MTIRAALLDANDVFLRIDELADESELTDRHVPEVTEVDFAPGAYRWDRVAKTFTPVPVFDDQSTALSDIEHIVSGAVELALLHRGDTSDASIAAGEILAIVRRRYPAIWARINT